MQDFPPRQPTQVNRSILLQFSQKMNICNNYNQMLETSTCNYDNFLFVLTLTGKSLEIRDYLKKIYIYKTRSEKNTVFDSLMVTTLKWNNVPRRLFCPSFGLEPGGSTLSSRLFLAKQCPLLQRSTTLEPHTPVSPYQRFVQQRELIYTIRPKDALNDPKDLQYTTARFLNSTYSFRSHEFL